MDILYHTFKMWGFFYTWILLKIVDKSGAGKFIDKKFGKRHPVNLKWITIFITVQKECDCE